MSANTSGPAHITTAICFAAAFLAVLTDRFVQIAVPRYVPWVQVYSNEPWFGYANIGVAALVALATALWARIVVRRRRASV